MPPAGESVGRILVRRLERHLLGGVFDRVHRLHPLAEAVEGDEVHRRPHLGGPVHEGDPHGLGGRAEREGEEGEGEEEGEPHFFVRPGLDFGRLRGVALLVSPALRLAMPVGDRRSISSSWAVTSAA